MYFSALCEQQELLFLLWNKLAFPIPCMGLSHSNRSKKNHVLKKHKNVIVNQKGGRRVEYLKLFLNFFADQHSNFCEIRLKKLVSWFQN